MFQPVHSIFIVVKADSPDLRKRGDEIAAFASLRGISVCVQENQFDTTQFTIPTKPDLVIVLGGDGTVLSVARKLPKREIPILGINFGQVGFLTEVQPEKWTEVLPQIFVGNYFISRRILFSFSVFRSGVLLQQGDFFNDLVISRGELARLIHLSVRYGEHTLGKVKADALVVSTPSGSSSYCVSAGGPLVFPEMQAFVICPVSPFLHNFQPMVLPSDEELSICVEEMQTQTALTLDGQIGFSLQKDDEVRIRRANYDIIFVQERKTTSFFEKLKTKGFLYSR